MEVAMKSEIGCHWAPWSLLHRLMVSSVVDVHIPLQVMRRWPWSCTSNVRIRMLGIGEFHDEIWPKTMKRWFGDFLAVFFLKTQILSFDLRKVIQLLQRMTQIPMHRCRWWPLREGTSWIQVSLGTHTLWSRFFPPGWETKLPRDFSLKKLNWWEVIHFFFSIFEVAKRLEVDPCWNVFLVQRTVLFVAFVDWGCRQLDLKTWTCFETYRGHAPTRQNDRWRRGTDNWGSKRGNVIMLFHFELKQPDVVRL